MVRLMKRRLFRSLVHVLIAAQALSFAPGTATLASGQSGTNAAMDCADMVGAGTSEPCPCCPDGVMDATACLSACSATVGAISTFLLPVANPASDPIVNATFLPRDRTSDPPLKPPPIA
jgi:hypothetical protein